MKIKMKIIFMQQALLRSLIIINCDINIKRFICFINIQFEKKRI